ncbi:hypothetical protein NM688_g80 [Phlebia brevispora]|uniref:Uncharacterized protein n=1 Tax=Phlebia brevispora TaxID=194682 RepID=A0ACC1TFP1_9APHY|nr:hypothetical protein NM688_g80 [Phlebia brevispora]
MEEPVMHDKRAGCDARYGRPVSLQYESQSIFTRHLSHITPLGSRFFFCHYEPVAAISRRVVTEFFDKTGISIRSWQRDPSNATEQRVREKVASWDLGDIAPDRRDRHVVTSINMATTAFGHTHSDVQVHIALFTVLALCIDDLEIKSGALEEFIPRLHTGTRQLHPVLDYLVDNLHHLPDYYPPYAACAIFAGTIQFINSTIFDKESENMALTAESLPYVLYKRARNSLGEVYGFFVDTMTYLNYANDILSFYKEELAGETGNFVHDRAKVTGKTIPTVLSELLQEVVESVNRARVLLQGEKEKEAWEQFIAGYVAFHFHSPRYRLVELTGSQINTVFSSNMSIDAIYSTSQNVTIPHIPELHNPHFLDKLLPIAATSAPTLLQGVAPTSPNNPMIDALKSTTHFTLTANRSPAYNSTLSATLDAFHELRPHCAAEDIPRLLEKAWNEDSLLTLRIIWNLRSIHDGKSEKELFYQAFGWLYEKHPRTAIQNLRWLVEPVCVLKAGGEPSASHGYWKDLLNIVALAAVNELHPSNQPSTFLHAPRTPPSKPHWGRRRRRWEQKAEESEDTGRTLLSHEEEQAESRQRRIASHERYHTNLIDKLAEPRFRALYVMVARLFAEKLGTQKSNGVSPDNFRWPENGRRAREGSHDRRTNLATAVAVLVLKGIVPERRPKFSTDPDTAGLHILDTHIVRSYYQRWVLRPLRQVLHCPEPLMSANRWGDIVYSRVPALCMKWNTEHFFKHDPERFEGYLEAVESGKKKISGATLMPHELLGASIKLSVEVLTLSSTDVPLRKRVRRKVAEMQLRTVELQWKTLIERLRASGSLDNALAICDVSGSMGGVYSMFIGTVKPLLPALALSLVTAQISKPPFANCFITFSARPQFVELDPSRTLHELVQDMVKSEWSMNTNLNAVFLDLLLPLAIKHKVKQEDMIKRLFIFSDMQFDESQTLKQQPILDAPLHGFDNWETNHDVIERAFNDAGYELPEIVYWNLAGPRGTTPIIHNNKGVALMSGFSPAMMKTFMDGPIEEDATAIEDWEVVHADGTTMKQTTEKPTPVDMMKKALSVASFDGLTVED